MVKPQIETILGGISAEDIGITLPHEHVVMDCSYCLTTPTTDAERESYYAPIALETLNWLRHNLYKSKTNVSIYNEMDAVISDLKLFKQAGGVTIVENTTIGINRDVEKMAKISKASGVNVICGTGYFVDETIPQEVKVSSVEKITETLISEINDGIGEIKVKPGIIGEVGSTWPITDAEKRSLQASAIAQTQTHTPVMIHPGADAKAPLEVLRIFQEADGDVEHAVIAHLDRTIPRNDDLLELADTGVFLEYDFFGSEISYMSPYTSDAQRMEKIMYLIDEGFGDKILISHDVHACHQLTKFGGIGFSHILDYAVPKMLRKGIAQDDIDRMLLSNPRAWLTYY